VPALTLALDGRRVIRTTPRPALPPTLGKSIDNIVQYIRLLRTTEPVWMGVEMSKYPFSYRGSNHESSSL